MRVNFRTSIKKKNKKKQQKNVFLQEKRTAIFSFKNVQNTGKNVLVGSSALPSLQLFVAKDIIAGAIVAEQNFGSPFLKPIIA